MRITVIAALAALLFASPLFASDRDIVGQPAARGFVDQVAASAVTFAPSEGVWDGFVGYTTNPDGSLDLPFVGDVEGATVLVWLLDGVGGIESLLTASDLGASGDYTLPKFYADADDGWGLPLTADVAVEVVTIDGERHPVGVFRLEWKRGGGPHFAAAQGGAPTSGPITNPDGEVEGAAMMFQCNKSGGCEIHITDLEWNERTKRVDDKSTTVVFSANVITATCDCD